MAAFTRAEATAILNWYFRGSSAPSIPAGGWYVALYTTAPTDNSAGTEASGGSYARVQVPAASWNAPTAADPPVVVSNAAITFPTATGSWGTVTSFGLFDVSTAGTVRYWGTLTASQAVASGVTFSIPSGSASFSLD